MRAVPAVRITPTGITAMADAGRAMTRIRQLNASRHGMIISSVLVFVIMFLLNSMTPYLVDDYGYMFSFADGTRVRTLSGLVQSMVRHCFTVNGRVVAHTLEQVFLMMPKPVFNICNALMFLFVFYSAYRISNFGKGRNVFLFLAICMCYWVFVPVFGQVTLWQDGSLNYLWALGFCFLFLRPYLALYLNEDKGFFHIPRTWYSIALFILGAFLFGMYSEITSLTGILMAVGFLIACRFHRRSLRHWLWIPVLAAVIGFLCMILMPAEQMNKAGASSIHDLLGVIPKHTGELKAWLGSLWAVWGALIVFAGIYRLNPQRLLISVAFALGSLAAHYVMIAAVFQPYRCMCTTTVFLIISCFVLVAGLLDSPSHALCKAAIGVLSVCFLFSFVTGIFDIHAVYSRSKERDRSAAEQILEGKQEIVLDIIYGSTEYSGVRYLKDLDLENPDTWPNTGMAKYYGVARVIGHDPQNENAD